MHIAFLLLLLLGLPGFDCWICDRHPKLTAKPWAWTTGTRPPASKLTRPLPLTAHAEAILASGRADVEQELQSSAPRRWPSLAGMTAATALTCMLAMKLLPLPINYSSMASLLDHSVMQSMVLIVLSELGDKTFFMTAMLAAKHGNAIASISSALALCSITVISVVFGQLIKALSSHPALSSMPVLHLPLPALPFTWTDYLVIGTFGWIGLSMLWEVCTAAPAHAPVAVSDDQLPSLPTASRIALLLKCVSMIFLAELGDRSFFSIFTMSVRQDVMNIFLGTVLGQIICVGLAVVFGEIIRRYMSEAMVSVLGGSIFLLYALLQVFRGLGR